MSISRRTQYALRAVYELAEHYGEGTMTAAAIAESQKIPLPFLEVIMCGLRQGGIVKSTRGSRGGYELSAAPADISIMNVIECIQERCGIVNCMAEGRNPTPCGMQRKCPFKNVWAAAVQGFEEPLHVTTFAELTAGKKRRH
ncbi:MAG: Rrf2 family transcriptional regulator [Planctomycetes bacterium]|nr:Rrf2 family transcriptional regulator [Planctomycetota bacterium]